MVVHLVCAAPGVADRQPQGLADSELRTSWLSAVAEQFLGASEDLRGGHFESGGDLEDVGERDVAFAALDAVVVAAIQAALRAIPFLGDPALLAQLAEGISECGMGR